MCYLKLLKPIMEGCLFETFRCDLKWDMLFETSETWNLKFFNPSKSCSFKTFRWDLKQDMLFETSKLFNPSQGCLLKHLKMFETWNCLNISWELLFWTFRWDLKKDVIFKTFETFETFQRGHLFETFETWNFTVDISNLKLWSVL